ncbi:MAG: hypothetical protein KGO47_08925 [Cyanobacteria bacterium REEB417]|nr:hypothetical protein [Cyanobacteria bacterium REEB417]
MNETILQGIYGPYVIDARDRREVLGYRLALLLAAVAQTALLLHWRLLGPQGLWPWLALLALGLGLALRWIHIYLRPLHRSLQVLWLLGCLGTGVMAWRVGPDQMIAALGQQRLWLLAIGPLFAALAGIGFKEFFCFRRVEAIGVTLLLPLALLGYLVGLLDPATSAGLMATESALLLVLCGRKFPMPAAADVGDKSVFAYLAGLERDHHPREQLS